MRSKSSSYSASKKTLAACGCSWRSLIVMLLQRRQHQWRLVIVVGGRMCSSSHSSGCFIDFATINAWIGGYGVQMWRGPTDNVYSPWWRLLSQTKCYPLPTLSLGSMLLQILGRGWWRSYYRRSLCLSWWYGAPGVVRTEAAAAVTHSRASDLGWYFL